MKTKYKYIKFVKFVGSGSDWICYGKKDLILGSVLFNNRWKEWEFCPEDGMAFTWECCRDIADFLQQLNKENKP